MFSKDEFVLMSDDLQAKEVYAYFGLVIFSFQKFEQQLMNMLLIKAKNENLNLTPEEYDEVFGNHSDKTMGKLIKKVTETYKINSELTREMWRIHKKRNYFAHHYFKDSSQYFFDLEGNIKMIVEFECVIIEVEVLDSKLNIIIKPLMQNFGVTDKSINEILKKIKNKEISLEDSNLCYKKH